MEIERQKIGCESSLKSAGPGEAREVDVGGDEICVVKQSTESLVSSATLMEEVVEKRNLQKALKRVKANGGSAGIDGMTVKELPKYLKEHWLEIKRSLLAGVYKPQAVKRVEIPKPDGGKRKLGIPTVLDRFIQQAVMQILQARWDSTFSEHSYGFRPGKSAHQAVAKAQEYIEQGYKWVVDIDLEKFFDRVNHDRLMASIAKRVEDKRLLKLIRAFLNSGVMENGLVSPTTEGTPQGGPLSPLLSNLVLDELDRELVRRGHRFVRYADDANTYVKSKIAGERVLQNITKFISKTLKLKVNETKSAVDRPWNRKILGFTFKQTRKGRNSRAPAPKAFERFKDKIRIMTRRSSGRNIEEVVKSLTVYLSGWINYFGFSQISKPFEDLDSWIRRRLRCMLWKQWGRRRYRELRARGVSQQVAWITSKSGRGFWRLSHSPAVQQALSNEFFAKLGLLSLAAALT
jgi:RNA-directed DNA polymerase